MQAVIEKVAKRDKKAETKVLVDDWEARIAGKEAELADEREAAAVKAAAAELAGAGAAGGVKAEPEAESAPGPAAESPAEGVQLGSKPGSRLHPQTSRELAEEREAAAAKAAAAELAGGVKAEPEAECGTGPAESTAEGVCKPSQRPSLALSLPTISLQEVCAIGACSSVCDYEGPCLRSQLGQCCVPLRPEL